MRHEFDFECFTPPIVNSRTLISRKEIKKTSLQVFLVIVASLISMGAIIVFAEAMSTISTVFSLVCILYVIVSIIGSGIVYTAYMHKGGAKVWLP